MDISIPGYKNKNIIGEGSFGSVYHCINRKSGVEVAVKVFKNDFFIREIDVVCRLRHPNIISCDEITITSNNKLALIMPLYDLTLNQFFEDPKNKTDFTILKNIIFQVFDGLDFLHQMGFMHGDIKHNNFLIKNGKVVMIDFGLAINPALARADKDCILYADNYLSVSKN